MLPFSFRSTVRFSNPRSLGSPMLIDEFVCQLEKLRAKDIQAERDCVSFKGGCFRFVTGMNLLVPICRGLITIKEKGDILRVTYKLSFYEMLLVASPMVVFLALFTYGHSHSVPGAICFAGFAFSFLAGGNILIAITRFQTWVRKCWKAVDKAEKTPSSQSQDGTYANDTFETPA